MIQPKRGEDGLYLDVTFRAKLTKVKKFDKFAKGTLSAKIGSWVNIFVIAFDSNMEKLVDCEGEIIEGVGNLNNAYYNNTNYLNIVLSDFNVIKSREEIAEESSNSDNPFDDEETPF